MITMRLISSVNFEISYTPKDLPELVSIRRSTGVTLEQIADSTKIGIRYLRAIEDGNLGKLTGGVYTVTTFGNTPKPAETRRP